MRLKLKRYFSPTCKRTVPSICFGHVSRCRDPATTQVGTGESVDHAAVLLGAMRFGNSVNSGVSPEKTARAATNPTASAKRSEEGRAGISGGFRVGNGVHNGGGENNVGPQFNNASPAGMKGKLRQDPKRSSNVFLNGDGNEDSDIWPPLGTGNRQANRRCGGDGPSGGGTTQAPSPMFSQGPFSATSSNVSAMSAEREKAEKVFDSFNKSGRVSTPAFEALLTLLEVPVERRKGDATESARAAGLLSAYSFSRKDFIDWWVSHYDAFMFDVMIYMLMNRRSRCKLLVFHALTTQIVSVAHSPLTSLSLSKDGILNYPVRHPSWVSPCFETRVVLPTKTSCFVSVSLLKASLLSTHGVKRSVCLLTVRLGIRGSSPLECSPYIPLPPCYFSFSFREWSLPSRYLAWCFQRRTCDAYSPAGAATRVRASAAGSANDVRDRATFSAPQTLPKFDPRRRSNPAMNSPSSSDSEVSFSVKAAAAVRAAVAAASASPDPTDSSDHATRRAAGGAMDMKKQSVSGCEEELTRLRDLKLDGGKSRSPDATCEEELTRLGDLKLDGGETSPPSATSFHGKRGSSFVGSGNLDSSRRSKASHSSTNGSNDERTQTDGARTSNVDCGANTSEEQKVSEGDGNAWGIASPAPSGQASSYPATVTGTDSLPQAQPSKGPMKFNFGTKVNQAASAAPSPRQQGRSGGGVTSDRGPRILRGFATAAASASRKERDTSTASEKIASSDTRSAADMMDVSEHPPSDPGIRGPGVFFSTGQPDKGRQTPARKTATPVRKTATPARKTATPARQSATPARQSATPARQSATPARQSATPARQSATPARQSATPASKVVTPANCTPSSTPTRTFVFGPAPAPSAPAAAYSPASTPYFHFESPASRPVHPPATPPVNPPATPPVYPPATPPVYPPATPPVFTFGTNFASGRPATPMPASASPASVTFAPGMASGLQRSMRGRRGPGGRSSSPKPPPSPGVPTGVPAHKVAPAGPAGPLPQQSASGIFDGLFAPKPTVKREASRFNVGMCGQSKAAPKRSSRTTSKECATAASKIDLSDGFTFASPACVAPQGAQSSTAFVFGSTDHRKQGVDACAQDFMQQQRGSQRQGSEVSFVSRPGGVSFLKTMYRYLILCLS